VFRAHGSRKYNEVWSYGKQAEPILEKYLRLRYQFLPYIYSLGRRTYQSGAPYMRALLDFPNDPKVADLGDEYMFGPAFVVAPVTEQGVTSRAVYLPASADWYNYWTNERVHGVQTIPVATPIDTLPLSFVLVRSCRLGSPSGARTKRRRFRRYGCTPERMTTSRSTRMTEGRTPTKKETAA
jgi:alpha-glucosidase (family GH31 glycosyl hydrolase)